ncbi:MAG: sialate O-acetylesterase [Verrucomicrobiales bacterium]
MKIPVFLGLSLCLAAPAAAQSLALHPLFGDHAVLQQELTVPVWGTAPAGAKVSAKFAGQEHATKADAEGNWMVVLDPLAASPEPRTMTVSAGDDSVALGDVLVGEVWIGSGQSNMAMTVSGSLSADEAAAAEEEGAYEGVRLFKVPVAGEDSRQATIDASWTLPEKDAVLRFSATAFFFAAKLARDRSVPVGIIQAANGGTNAFSWINTDTLENDPAAETVRAYWNATLKNYPAAKEKYEAARAEWQAKTDAAKARGEKHAERPPRAPLGNDHVKRPAGHYNAMIAPLQPYAIRGVVWYQGEANSRSPFNVGYKDLMFSLVDDWRTDWAEASEGKLARRDFPFYLVQLPGFGGGDPEGWPLVREQMLRFWEEGTNTGMVVAIDKGEADDIHPRAKKPIGERLASFARAKAYGENIVFSGPIYDSLRIEGDKAIVSFRHAAAGLAALDKKPLRHFEVAGADGEFHPAEAEIEGNQLVVTSEEEEAPRAVRYAWKANPEGANFGNLEGFPASPFRTDSW